MDANPGYATLRMTLRPPRVAVVFDGGKHWTYWARLAIYACTRVWGGQGFILIPHTGGRVRPEILAAVRVYDPDYVVALQRTVRTAEQAAPGSLALHGADGQPLDDADRAEAVLKIGENVVSSLADETARTQVASICSPHRRVDDTGGRGWDEDITMLPIDGDTLRLTTLAQLPTVSPHTCLSAPPHWDGPLGVTVAAACGMLVEPLAGRDPVLGENDHRQLLHWLVDPDPMFGGPPQDLVWHPHAALSVDPATLSTAFDSTLQGLVSIGRSYRPRRQALISVGDTADDFALAYAHRRLYGFGIWLSITEWPPEGSADALPLALRHLASRQVMRANDVVISTTSVDSAAIDAMVDELRQPVAWAEGDHEATVTRYRGHISQASIDWNTSSTQHLAVDGQFDQDYPIPISRNAVGDVEMIVRCPAPVVTQPDLAAAQNLHWQVEVEIVGCPSPRGRGLDGHVLFADAEDRYLTWVRSGRDGTVYESERFDLIVTGTPAAARLARPRFRVPSLSTWADLMATQNGGRMRLSAAGRRVEAMRQLWGDRADLAAQIAGPMLPVLRMFRPSDKKSAPRFEDDEGVVLPTGVGDRAWEGYLTLAGALTSAGAGDDTATDHIRAQLDAMLELGMLRRGLILGCAQCGRQAFVSIDDLAQVNKCPRCSARNILTHARWRPREAEPRWFYDLHPTVREHLSQDGDIPLLLSNYLRSSSRHGYVDVAEMELVDTAGKPLAEADLIALSGGTLITAEAKRPASLGAGRALRRTVAKRVLLADRLCADQILIATAGAKWEPGSIEALRSGIRNRRWAVKPPTARLISGLGTDEVTDMELDIGTGEFSPWQQP